MAFMRDIVRTWVRVYWMWVLCWTALVAALWWGAPAWGAPVLQGSTLPLSTPTSVSGPPPTATPRPNNNDNGNDSGNDGGGNGGAPTGGAPVGVVGPVGNVGVEESSGQEPGAPAPVFSGGGGAAAAPAPDPELTAQVVADTADVHDGPGTSFELLGTLALDSQVEVLARDEDGLWWYVCCVEETAGWVRAALLEADFDGAEAENLLSVLGAEATVEDEILDPEADEVSEVVQAERALTVDFEIAPYFVRQGITVTLQMILTNPNEVDALDVVLSNELPAMLTLVETRADAGGRVQTLQTESGSPLLLFRWAQVAAGSKVIATVVVQVSPQLERGDVFDNLVATQGRNVPYAGASVTIGMPPTRLPDFR